eukprot:TRINITY_DN1468_c0_g1_i1.p2 TRINITY_DN1468_c0_g1~~TRINITY_DN1468_c0_g1_i1.p2  ORF type:complete len:311 (-),score=107.72 TRINITY_DN1468_c0_g1_i1:134-1066(-)
MKLFIATVITLLSYVDGQAVASASANAVSFGGGVAYSNAAASAFTGKKGYSYPYRYPYRPSVRYVDPVVYVKPEKSKKEKPIIVVVDDKKDDKKVDDIKVAKKDDDKKKKDGDRKKKDDDKKAVTSAEAASSAVAKGDGDDDDVADCTTVAAAATGTPELSTLVAALTEAGLVDTLADTDFVGTVFAPTNAAFERLIEQFGVTVDELLADSQLGNILLYHVVGGAAVFSTDLSDGDTYTTLLEQDLGVQISDETITIVGAGSSANVIVPDTEACKAVVHVIDEVLLPDFDLLTVAAGGNGDDDDDDDESS